MNLSVSPEQLDKLKKLIPPDRVKKLETILNSLNNEAALDEVKKNIPADKLQKLEAVISLLSGGKPQNLQFKCRQCDYLGSHSEFKQGNNLILACPSCQKKDLQVITPLTEQYLPNEQRMAAIQPQPPTENIITSNQRAKVAVIIILIMTMAWLLYNFVR